MAYILLVLSVFSNALKGYSSKRVGKYINSSFENSKMNTIRGFLCLIISFLILLICGKLPLLSLNPQYIFIAMISGTSMAVFQIAWIYAVKRGAYMTVGAFGTASFLIPLFCGIFILREKISLTRGLALILILVAVYLMCLYNNSIKTKLSHKTLATLISVTVFQGISQFLQKIYMTTEKNDVGVYTFYMFLGMCISLVIFDVFELKREKSSPKLDKKVLVYILLMSTGLFLTTYLQSVASKFIDASVMYPLVNVLGLCASIFMSQFLFKEKINKKSIAGMILVFCAIMLYLK